MKTRITSKNLSNIKTHKVFYTLLFLLLTTGSYADITVESVFPRRVTAKTQVTITGGTGFSTDTTVSIAGISTSDIAVSDDGTEISFVISNTTFYQPGSTPIPGLDVGPVPLKIDDDSVYVDGMIVFLEYVAPELKLLNAASTFNVTEVFTNWNGFWRSDWYKSADRTTWPDDRHDLLAFSIKQGVNTYTYSTGVDDQILRSKGIPFIDQNFKAYSTNGVKGRPHSENYLAMADKIDRAPGETNLNNYVRKTVFDVLIDGENGHGLDLGTGITNFNKVANIRFYSGNGQSLGAVDAIPDLLITQIAEPGGWQRTDIYYYADDNGNVVGRPIRLQVNNDVSSPVLFKWRLDFYRMNTSVDYEFSLPNATTFITKDNRDYRMAAFKMSDFYIGDDIANQDFYIGNVNNINMMAGGSADISFMAYNRMTHDIRSPLVDLYPVSRFICELKGTTNVVFDARVGVDGLSTSDPDDPEYYKEKIKYRWYKNKDSISNHNFPTFTVAASSINDFDEYRLRAYNKYGTVDMLFNLSQGGTPTTWDGNNWRLPSRYYDGANERYVIEDKDRNLIFSENYNEEVNLEGCDCVVPAGSTVTIPEGNTLKLYSTITVDGELQVFDDSDPPVLTETIPAGTFTLENNASLIQTKEVEENENTDNIIVKRNATGLKQYDYVYWSSPVDKGKLNMIPGATSHVYRWEVNTGNNGVGSGNWGPVPDGNMESGRGYIKRVNDASDINTVFDGVPNNGNIGITVYQTQNPGAMDEGDRHWNLIGNPYPSAISADAFLLENAANVNNNAIIDGGVYIWTHGTLHGEYPNPFYNNFGSNYNPDDYLVYNGVASNYPKFDGFIASGQGFFVRARAHNAEVKFTNAMRESDHPAYDNSQFFRGTATNEASATPTSEKQVIWLSLINEAKIATVGVVGYAQGATYGEDNLYDAPHMGNNNFSLYTEVADKRMVIQGRPLPFDNSDKVSLGIAIPKNGIYRIGIDHLKGSIMLNEEQGIYLEDIYNNVIHDLRTAPYSFTASKGDIKDRFVLRYTNRSLSVDDQKMAETFVYIKNEQLYVKASQNIQSVVVYDLTGKKLLDYKVSGSADAINTSFQFPKGVYLTEIKLENAGVVTKKVMN